MIVDRSRLSQLVEAYRREHSRWVRTFPPLLRGSFSTEFFREHSFDDSQSDLFELHHFAGGMQVDPIDDVIDFISPLVDGIAFTVLKKIIIFYQSLERQWSESVADLPQRFGQPLFCWSSLFRSAITPIALRKIFGDRKLNVLEVGPGSGYAALMFSLEHHQVTTIDISPGYGCWQSVLFDCFGRYIEDAHLSDVVAPTVVSPGSVYSLTPHLEDRIDVLIANHMLNEMSRHSLVMLLESLRRLGLSPLIVCDRWGFGSRTDPARNAQTERLLNWFGYVIKYHAPESLTGGGVSVDNPYRNQIPITVFEKVREKSLVNCFTGESSSPVGAMSRDLSIYEFADDGYMRALAVRDAQVSVGADLRGMFEKHVSRDMLGAPILRTELTFLDYIGLNSNTKRPYVRGGGGQHF